MKVLIVAFLLIGLVLGGGVNGMVIGETPKDEAALVDADVIDEFETFIVTHNNYDPQLIYGLGDEFTTSLMRAARFKYALSNHSADATTLVRFYSMPKPLIECRLAGYLETCRHPFGENNPNAGTDVTPPYHVDFIVTDEPFEPENITDIQNFPLFVLGISPVFHVDGLEKLTLSQATLAKIFRGCDELVDVGCLPGSITSWGHPEIKATNPPSTHALLDAAGHINVVVEKFSSASTGAFKRACSRFEQGFADQIDRKSVV